MKSLRRRLINGLSAVSLLLCVVTVTSWVVGALHPTALRWKCSLTHAYFAAFDGGRVVWVEQKITPPVAKISSVPDASHYGKFRLTTPVGWELASCSFNPAAIPRFKILGFGVSTVHPITGVGDEHGHSLLLTQRMTVVVTPYWPMCRVFAALPAFWWRAWRRDVLRRREGRCPACGYDLRASPDRCPECGAAAPKKESIQT